MPGKCFGKGEANITETGQHRPFYREVFLSPRGADSFGKLHAIITRLEQKHIGKKGGFTTKGIGMLYPAEVL